MARGDCIPERWQNGLDGHQVTRATLRSMKLEEEKAIANDPSDDANAFFRVTCGVLNHESGEG